MIDDTDDEKCRKCQKTPIPESEGWTPADGDYDDWEWYEDLSGMCPKCLTRRIDLKSLEIKLIPNKTIREHFESELKSAKLKYIRTQGELSTPRISLDEWILRYKTSTFRCAACCKAYSFKDVETINICCAVFSLALHFDPQNLILGDSDGERMNENGLGE